MSRAWRRTAVMTSAVDVVADINAQSLVYRLRKKKPPPFSDMSACTAGDRIKRNMTSRIVRRVVFVLTVVFTFATAVTAQSGRRSQPKSETPTPPPISEPTPTPSKPHKMPDLQLLVAIEDPSPISGVPLYAADTVFGACMQRLREPAGIAVKAGPRRMTRGEAIKAAKAEATGYVVWLEVGNENTDSSGQAGNSAEGFYVNYLILEPGTAKVKQSGRAHYSARKVGNIGVRTPIPGRTSPAYFDYVLKEEARDTAEQILRALGVREVGG